MKKWQYFQSRTAGRVATTSTMLVPPPNFGMVEESLYRSGQPDQLNFPFLEKLSLRSVIWLAPEEPEVGL